MRIIIEGCDKAGKSSLIHALKNEIPSLLGIKLLSVPRDNKPESKRYIQMAYAKMAELSRDQSFHYVFDRFYPSQMVYSFKRDANDMEDGWFWKFEQELAKTPSLYVYLDVPKDVLKKRFKTEKEDYVDIADINRIVKRYEKHFDQCQLNKIKIDPTDDMKGAVEKIKKAIDDILDYKTVDYTNKEL